MRLQLRLVLLAFGLMICHLACGGGSGGPGAAPPAPATAPVITVQPIPQTVSSGTPAMFVVVATGSGTLTYQWKRNGLDIPNGQAPSFSTGPTNVLDHGQTFAVVVSNAVGSVTSATVSLSVNEPPVVHQQPNDLVLIEGQNATFTILVQGTPPLVYQWKRNGLPIPGANGTTYSIASVARSDDQSRFAAVATNGLGSVETRAALLQVGGLLTAPVIHQQPTGMNVSVGQTATFLVGATGSEPLSFQWRRNGTPLPGANASTLSIPDVQAADAGDYSAVVSNGAGSATSQSATLVVNVVPPSITMQPVSAVVGTGQTATFQVGVAGSPPFSYQWRKNSIDLPGATSNSYTTPPTALSDNNSAFTVRVTNPIGSVISSPAILKVFLARTVSGEGGILRLGPAGETAVPRDLRAADIAAFQVNGQNVHTKTPGLGFEDGSFSIPGIPPGAFLAVLDPLDGNLTRGLWATLDSLDFRTYQTGRSDAKLSVVGQTSIKVQLSGSLPAPIERIELSSPTLSLVKSHPGPIYSWPWLGLPLFEAAKDSVWITAFRAQNQHFGSMSSIQGAVKLAPFSLPDLGQTLLNAPMSAAVANQSYQFQADVPAFGNLLPLVNPTYQAATGRGQFKLQLRGQTYGADIGPIPDWVNILDLATTQTGLLNTGLLPYADPYPEEWRRLLLVRQEFSLELPMPGGEPVLVEDAIQEIWPRDLLLPGSLPPRSAPVDQPRINGISLFTPPASVGAAPLITWVARAGVAATFFKVTLFQVDDATRRLIAKADFHTEAPSLILPPGRLIAGSSYVIRISMVWAQQYDPLLPMRPTMPISEAPVYSGVFKP